MHIPDKVFNEIYTQALKKLEANKDRPMSEATIEAEAILDVLDELKKNEITHDADDLVNRI